jgi:hypothetical protein
LIGFGSAASNFRAYSHFAGAKQGHIKLDPPVDIAAAQAAPRGTNG